jgi:hypothetical protein
MTAKIAYAAKNADPAVLTWPLTGPPNERFTFTSGQSTVVQGLIGYGDGTATYPDGRLFPALTAQGSTLTHQNN